MSMDKPIAFVTGGNRGIGFELVKQLAVKGFKVILSSRDPKKGYEALEKLKDPNLDISYMMMDVDEQDSIRQSAHTVNEKYGRLDVLINNAGIYVDGDEKLITMDPSILEKTMRTNFFGPYFVIHSFIPLMEKRGYGRIINISSELGAMSDMSVQGTGAYKLSKLALNGMTQLMATEIKGDIKINSVDPGWVSSDMGGPYASVSPKQAAESILWLATIGPEGPNGGFFRNGKSTNW
ncbi:SDR family oxidoreductase [Peribacillus muralis]|uniref:SDR family oxidoreductase n=1 Tax=Peribacillus muralis TaxID=264697 RepID=UPI00071078C0|nr:SDR family oxidoreductase [Peribacillus muralis]